MLKLPFLIFLLTLSFPSLGQQYAQIATGYKVALLVTNTTHFLACWVNGYVYCNIFDLEGDPQEVSPIQVGTSQTSQLYLEMDFINSTRVVLVYCKIDAAFDGDTMFTLLDLDPFSFVSTTPLTSGTNQNEIADLAVFSDSKAVVFTRDITANEISARLIDTDSSILMTKNAMYSGYDFDCGVLDDDTLVFCYGSGDITCDFYDTDLDPVAGSFTISGGGNDNNHPFIYPETSGYFILTRDQDIGGSDLRIKIRRESAGGGSASDVQISDVGSNSIRYSKVAKLPNGNYFVIYHVSDTTPSTLGGAIVDSTLSSMTDNFDISLSADNGSWYTLYDVQALSDSKGLVVYTSETLEIYMQVFCFQNSHCSDPVSFPVCVYNDCEACTVDLDCQDHSGYVACLSTQECVPEIELSITVQDPFDEAICEDEEFEILTATNYTGIDYELSADSIGGTVAGMNSYFDGLGSVEGSIPLSKSYLELNEDYDFTFEYELDSITSPTISINPLDFLSASVSNIIIDRNDQLNAQIAIKNCLPAKAVDYNWNQISASPVFSIDPWTSNTGSTIQINACELQAHTLYEYEYELFYTEDPTSIFTLNVEIQVEKQNFNVELSAPSSIAANQELELSTSLSSSCDIPDDTVEYKWLCEVQKSGDGEFEDCEDPDGLFGEYSTSADTLTLPVEYLDSEDILRITVRAKLGENILNDKINVNVTSYLQLDLLDEDISCSFKVRATIDDSESDYSYLYTWELASTLEDVELQDQVFEFLAKQTIPQIIFPAYLIELGSTYTFNVAYTNFKSNSISDSLSIVASSQLPTVTFLGGNDQQLPIFLDFEIKALSPCMPGSVEQVWSQLQGPSLTLSDLTTSPNVIAIPECMLDPSTTYKFRYTLTSPDDESETDIVLTTQIQKYRPVVEGGDTNHLGSKDLELQASVISEGGCPYVGGATLTYYWECKVAERRIDDFVACADPDSLFGVENADPSMVIPKEYFQVGNILGITIIIYENGVPTSNKYISRIEITDDNIFGASISCESDLSCYVFSPQKEYRFSGYVSYQGLSNIESYWVIKPLFKAFSFIDKFRTIPIEGTIDRADFNYDDILIGYNIKNQTHGSYVEYIIPFNFAPHEGTITSSIDEGLVLASVFTFEAPSWTDENLPLFYEFRYGLPSEPVRKHRLISLKSQTNSASSILTLNKLSKSKTKVSVRVDVSDPYDAKNFAVVEVKLLYKELSTTVLLEQMNQTLTLIAGYDDIEQQVQQLSLISNHFSGIDKKIMDTEDGCSCSGNGECNDDSVCECDEGYTSKYCEISSTNFEELEELKLELLDILRESVESTKDKAKTIEIVADLTNSTLLNTDQTISAGKDIVDLVIAKNDSEAIPTFEVSEKTSEVIDNMVSYVGETDCEAVGNLTQDIKEDMEVYLNKIAKGLVSESLTDEEPQILNENQYSIYSQKLTECSLVLNSLATDSISPSVRVSERASDREKNCTKELLVSYFSFSDQIFDCERGGQELISSAANKPILILQIQDFESGEDLSSEYKVEIKNPEGIEGCQEGCEPSQFEPDVCNCDSASSLFDIGGQIERVFTESNFGKILDTSIADWDVVNSVQFWLILGTGVVLGGCAALIHLKLANFCMVDSIVKKGAKISGLQAIKTLFVLNHPFLNAFFINSIKPSKLSRLGLFFCRMMMMLCVVSIMGPNSGFAFSGRMLAVSVSLDIYILIVPFVTFIPIEALLRIMLAQDHKKKDPSRKKLICCLKFTRGLAIFLVIAISAVCIYGIISIGEGSSNEENKELLGLLGRTLAQDWIVTPFILMLITFVVQEENATKVMALKESSEPDPPTQQKIVKKNQILPMTTEGIETQQQLITHEPAETKPQIKFDSDINKEENQEEEKQNNQQIEEFSQNLPLIKKNDGSLELNKSDSERMSIKDKDDLRPKLAKTIGTLHLDDNIMEGEGEKRSLKHSSQEGEEKVGSIQRQISYSKKKIE